MRDEIRGEGEAPTLTSGENPITFTCDAPAGCSARAVVTTITTGAPLAG